MNTFVLDRDSTIGTEGAQLAAEVMNNDIVNYADAAKDGHLVVMEHPGVWYTAEGGITALGVMIEDLEKALGYLKNPANKLIQDPPPFWRTLSAVTVVTYEFI